MVEQWEKVEKFMQDTLSPLLNHINTLSMLKKGDAPTHRLAIIQVGAGAPAHEQNLHTGPLRRRPDARWAQGWLAHRPPAMRPAHLPQVLLCRLIDMLDNAVPWDVGRKYDLEAGECVESPSP